MYQEHMNFILQPKTNSKESLALLKMFSKSESEGGLAPKSGEAEHCFSFRKASVNSYAGKKKKKYCGYSVRLFFWKIAPLEVLNHLLIAIIVRESH